jgi:hypothetical protein
MMSKLMTMVGKTMNVRASGVTMPTIYDGGNPFVEMDAPKLKKITPIE